VTRWTGDDVRYAPKPKVQPLIRQPDIPAGAPLDSDLWPVVWSAPVILLRSRRDAAVTPFEERELTV